MDYHCFPKCCYVCLKADSEDTHSLLSQLSVKNVQIKTKDSQLIGSSWDGIITTKTSTTTFSIPICRTCEKEDRKYRLKKVAFSILSIPVSFLLFSAVISFVGLVLEKVFSLPHTIIANVMGISSVLYFPMFIYFIVKSVHSFKQRNCFGLDKDAYREKTLKFMNQEYERIVEELNRKKRRPKKKQN